MYIYETGKIGEAIHAKIQNAKGSVRGGERNTESFSSILRSLMTDSSEKTKPVASFSDSLGSRPAGSTLIYAINNAAADDTAAAVVSSLGIPTGTSNTVSANSEGLLSAVSLLEKLKGSDSTAITEQLLKFTERYNALLSDLNAQGTSSSYMYSNLLRTAARTAAEPLAAAGITADENGKLSLDAGKFETLDIDGFLATVSSAVSSVASYASTIRNSSGLLDFLTGNEDSGSETINYMTSLLNLYT